MERDHEECRLFVDEVVRTGLMLAEVLPMLLEEWPEDAYPGEEPANVLLGMVAGSFMPAAEAAGAKSLRDATALVGALADRMHADLREAAARSQ